MSTPLGGQIPDTVIVKHPSSKVRTNEPVAYVDAANGGEVRTPNFRVGAVTMFARMNRFSILPFGPDGAVHKPCAGTARVSDQDSPQTEPGACWWTYRRSSAGQAGQVYPFRAEADWTVYVIAAGRTRAFASFAKYDDLQLPVNDIQTLVIG